MIETLVSFNVAKSAKEKGFDWECRNVYEEDEQLYELAYYESGGKVTNSQIPYAYFSSQGVICTAPTQSLLQKWLREVHNINIGIDYRGIESDSMEYCYIIKYLPKEFSKAKRWVTHIVEIESGQFHVNNTYSGFYGTYEEALEGTLLQTLTLII
jgi:hypothetical protein